MITFMKLTYHLGLVSMHLPPDPPEVLRLHPAGYWTRPWTGPEPHLLLLDLTLMLLKCTISVLTRVLGAKL